MSDDKFIVGLFMGLILGAFMFFFLKPAQAQQIISYRTEIERDSEGRIMAISYIPIYAPSLTGEYREISAV